MSQPETTYDKLLARSERTRRLLRQEELIIDVTEALAEVLVAKGMTRSELAKRLGKSKSFVTQILGGDRNLTLRTLADVADALDCQPRLKLAHRSAPETKTRGTAVVIQGPWCNKSGWSTSFGDEEEPISEQQPAVEAEIWYDQMGYEECGVQA